MKRVDFNPANKTMDLIRANLNYDPRRFSCKRLEFIKIKGHVVACYHKL